MAKLGKPIQLSGRMIDSYEPPSEAELLRIAKTKWQGYPGSLNPGMHFITGENAEHYKDNPERATFSRYVSEQMDRSRILLHAVGKAPLNDVPLYRGTRPNEDQTKSPLASWTSDKAVARKFARQYGGKVITANPGTVQAFQMPRGSHSESEYLVKREGHPYWAERHPGHTVGNNPGLWNISEEWK
jgi:hypothetical protein